MDERDPDEETIQRRRANANAAFGCLGEAVGCGMVPGLLFVLLLPLGLMHWM